MKRYLAAAMLLLALSGCGSSGSSTQLYTTTEDFFAMDTYMSVDVSSEKSESAAEDMAVKIEQRVNQLDAALSRTQQAGDLYKLNHANGQPTEVSDDTYTALEKALEYAEMTNGAFDPTMAPLTDLWGIGTDNARVPAQSEIDEALTHVGYQNVKLLGNNQVQLLNGAQVDLGGIGKGYAGDIVHEMAESDTSDQWHVLARLSGNIEMYGGKTAARTTGTSALPIRTTTRTRLRWCRCVTARLLLRVITSGFLKRTANATTIFLTPQQGIRRTAACAA